MPDTTKKKSKKNAPILCAVIMIAFLAIFIAVILFPLLGESYGDVAAVGFLVIYCLIIVAIIAGILVALHQRLKEIEGGEEDDAKKY